MNHLDYIFAKRDKTISEFDRIMKLNGMFKDLEIRRAAKFKK